MKKLIVFSIILISVEAQATGVDPYSPGLRKFFSLFSANKCIETSDSKEKLEKCFLDSNQENAMFVIASPKEFRENKEIPNVSLCQAIDFVRLYQPKEYNKPKDKKMNTFLNKLYEVGGRLCANIILSKGEFAQDVHSSHSQNIILVRRKRIAPNIAAKFLIWPTK